MLFEKKGGSYHLYKTNTSELAKSFVKVVTASSWLFCIRIDINDQHFGGDIKFKIPSNLVSSESIHLTYQYPLSHPFQTQWPPL